MATKTRHIVYCALNKINGKRYIGTTRHSLETRRREHEKQARNVRRTYLHKSMHKHGISAFDWMVLNTYSNLNDAREGEKQFIHFYDTFAPKGYNLTLGGEGALGVTVSAETRAKISAANTGRRHTAESRARMSRAQTGRKHSAETRSRISSGQMGKKQAAFRGASR